MENNHFNEEEIAICAEAIKTNRLNNLAKKLLNHLETCELCRQEILEVAGIVESIDERQLRKIDRRKNPSVRYLIGIGSVAASLLLVLYTLFYSKKEEAQIAKNDIPVDKYVDINEDTTIKSKKIDSIINNSNKNKKIKLKPNSFLNQKRKFKKSTELEALVQRYKNSANRSIETNYNYISLLKFKIKENIVLNILNEHSETFIVEIFNYKNEKLKEFETNNTKLSIKNNFKAGNYYWKLLNEDFDLLFCGKIQIK
jgi:hypothetical protein